MTIVGEQDIIGNPWAGFNQTTVTTCWVEGKKKKAVTVCEDQFEATDTLWNGGDWNGATWSGATWSGATWSAATWLGTSWTGATWSGATWFGLTWD